MFRFHKGRRPIDFQGRTIAKSLSHDESVKLFQEGNFGTIAEGHEWLCRDLARRALDYFNLPSHWGIELSDVALGRLMIFIAEEMEELPRSFAAYLASVAETAIADHIHDDNNTLSIPPSSLRALAKNENKLCQSGLRTIDFDSLTYNRVEQQYLNYFGLQTVEELFPFCGDDIDKQIITIRYDGGAGPIALEEVSGIIGIHIKQCERRLAAIEYRVYQYLDRPMPRRKRSPGVFLGYFGKSG